MVSFGREFCAAEGRSNLAHKNGFIGLDGVWQCEIHECSIDYMPNEVFAIFSLHKHKVIRHVQESVIDTVVDPKENPRGVGHECQDRTDGRQCVGFE